MRLKIFSVAVLALFFVAGSALAVDVTGTWVAEQERPKMTGGGPGGGGGGGMGSGPGGGMGQMPSGPMKYTFNLKADGKKLTGTMVGRQGTENEITEGKIDGDKLSFVVKISFGQTDMSITYDGTIKDKDTIEFKTKMAMPKMQGGPGGGGMGGGAPPERPPLIAKRQK